MNKPQQDDPEFLRQQIDILQRQVNTLAKTQNRYQALTAHDINGICIHDLEGRLLEVNQSFCTMLGYTETELLQMSVADIDGCFTQQQIIEQAKVVIQQGEDQFETQHRTKGGTLIDLDISVHYLAEDPPAIMAFLRNITQRKQQEREIQEAHDMNRAVFDAITESMFTIDTQGMVVAANETSAQRFGQSVQTFIGSNIRHLALQQVPEHLQAQRWSKVEQVITTKESLRFLAERHGCTYDTCFYPVINTEGSVSHLIIYAQDITKQLKQEKKLVEFQAKMVNAERLASVGTLSAMAAHELSQPLTVVQLSAQNALALLQNNSAPQKAIEELKECAKGLSDANLIIKRFRKFAHSKPERLSSSLSLWALTKNIIKMLQDACRNKHLTVDATPLQVLPPISYHKKDIEQLIYIIIENSLEAASDQCNHSLSIKGEIHDQTLVLTFTDDCGGIPAAHIDDIFKPFFTTRSYDKNTGLGLCVAQHIIEELRGGITVDNHPGQGVTFRLHLPLGEQTIPPEPS